MTIALLVVLAVVALWVVGAYNGLIALKNQVANAWKQIDVQLKRRHDLIPNLVNAVKGQMDFEKSTLEAVISARAKAVGATGVAATARAEGELTQALGKLFALAENYPDLKSSANVLQLQEELQQHGEQDRVRPAALQRRGDAVQHEAGAVPHQPRRGPRQGDAVGALGDHRRRRAAGSHRRSFAEPAGQLTQ